MEHNTGRERHSPPATRLQPPRHRVQGEFGCGLSVRHGGPFGRLHRALCALPNRLMSRHSTGAHNAKPSHILDKFGVLSHTVVCLTQTCVDMDVAKFAQFAQLPEHSEALDAGIQELALELVAQLELASSTLAESTTAISPVALLSIALLAPWMETPFIE